MADIRKQKVEAQLVVGREKARRGPGHMDDAKEYQAKQEKEQIRRLQAKVSKLRRK